MTHESTKAGTAHHHDTGTAAWKHLKGVVVRARRPRRTPEPGCSDSLANVTDQQAHRFERGTDGPKVVLVGLDGSDTSLRAVAYAVGLARRQHALLAIVYVQPLLAAGAALGAPVAGTTDEIAEQLVAEIREAAEQVKGVFEVRWEFHTFRGDPYNGLVTAADEAQGGRGRGGRLPAGRPPHRRLGGPAPGEGGPLAGDGGAVAPAGSRAALVARGGPWVAFQY